jgi:transposase InsO family protein
MESRDVDEAVSVVIHRRMSNVLSDDKSQSVLALGRLAWSPRRIEVGDSYDNALAESVIGLYKTEVIRRRGPWRDLEAVEFVTLEWASWFNNRRLVAPIGGVPPAEYEERYYLAQEAPAMMAGVSQ